MGLRPITLRPLLLHERSVARAMSRTKQKAPYGASCLESRWSRKRKHASRKAPRGGSLSVHICPIVPIEHSTSIARAHPSQGLSGSTPAGLPSDAIAAAAVDRDRLHVREDVVDIVDGAADDLAIEQPLDIDRRLVGEAVDLPEALPIGAVRERD